MVLFAKIKEKLFLITLFCFILLSSMAGLWERPELTLYDTWFKVRGVKPAPHDIVIVAMDDRSIQEIGILPWPRKVHAQLIEKLQKAQVIGFDLLFDTAGNPQDNGLMADAMKAHGNVVLASVFSFEQQGNTYYQRPIFPVDELAFASSGIGFINTPEDIDNVVRRISAVDVNTFEKPFPCFNLAVLLAAQKLSPDQLSLSESSILQAGKVKASLNDENQLMIDFWGPGGTFKTYSYVDIIKGRIDPQLLAEKIVLVGPTTSLEQDFKYTPFTKSNMVLAGALPTPGVEVHASAIATYLNGSYYQRAPFLINVLFLIAIGLLAAFVIYRCHSPWRGLLYLLGVIVLATTTVFIAWFYGHFWLNLVTPLGMSLLIYSGITAEKLIRTELERRRTRALFGRYVSPTVVEEILKHKEDIALGGSKVELTVLFSDIRGFTSFSENKPPETIVQRLNEYFSEMTAVVLKHGGTLDKYLGDGMMAFFGAPIYYENHADRALEAAKEMLDRLADLNHRWLQRGEPQMEIGIGINSGPVVVGNVGSPERMDYTIIGEGVNLASRLESINKEYDTKIIISEGTVRSLKDPLWAQQLKYLGETNIRGMSSPVGIYTLETNK